MFGEASKSLRSQISCVPTFHRQDFVGRVWRRKDVRPSNKKGKSTQKPTGVRVTFTEEGKIPSGVDGMAKLSLTTQTRMRGRSLDKNHPRRGAEETAKHNEGGGRCGLCRVRAPREDSTTSPEDLAHKLKEGKGNGKNKSAKLKASKENNNSTSP